MGPYSRKHGPGGLETPPAPLAESRTALQACSSLLRPVAFLVLGTILYCQAQLAGSFCHFHLHCMGLCQTLTRTIAKVPPCLQLL